ncbi:MAG: serine/threonine-protein phosphatase [Gemmatimonadales bacterium]|nr:serine/threonine-protein phosphatase [Gemmatimonadales bacterium]MBA3554928.1 serine/threonine-protein phosphatase [Gemmatimonadales bacterium]
MTARTPTPSRSASDSSRKPRDDELDAYGLTHTGLVRRENQDHFLICSLRKEVVVHGSSLPELGGLGIEPERLAFLAMVADGVGGGQRGEEASRLAVETVTQYVAESARCYYAGDASRDDGFLEKLEEAALLCHADIVRRAEQDPDRRGMATTLTLWLGLWPRAYLLQVGDSRCYLLRRDELTQVSRDQTMAQDLVDAGVLTRTVAANSRLAHTLSSAIGGRQTDPVITRMQQEWGSVGLLCSDGLTRHVSDERIRDRLRAMTSAKQVCEDLLQDALDGGGSDNITIVVGRSVRRGAA